MPELNVPPCPIHGAPPRALHTHNFEGIVAVAESIIETISGVGTISYTRCPYGYGSNFEGVVRVLEDLNASISGIAPSVRAGSGIYLTPSGAYTIINADYGVIVSGALVPGANVAFDYLSEGKIRVNTAAIISGGVVAVNVQGSEPPKINGTLWYDTNQGRLFVYGSGAAADPAGWYQTNADAIALKSAYPPSGAGQDSPARDGSLWYNTSLGSLFIYDVTTSGWYETAPGIKGADFGTGAPTPEKEGSLWYSATESTLKVWDGDSWISV
jgi:hypothetical protein